MNNFYFKKNTGTTLVEMLVYVIIFSFLSVVVFNAIINMTNSFKAVAVDTELMKTSSVIERMSREIRNSYDIAGLVSGDYIKLNYTNESGQPDSRVIKFTNNNLELWEDEYSTGNLLGQLNSENLEIVSASFSQITTNEGKAIRFNITSRPRLYGSAKEANFQNTIVLRGAY